MNSEGATAGVDRQMARQNCWEFMQCGREPGGKKTSDLGVCPAATEKRLDGMHHGFNAGRACWVVAGTLCKGEVQGFFAKKYQHCSQCRFYTQVRDEELPNFSMAPTLLSKLRA